MSLRASIAYKADGNVLLLIAREKNDLRLSMFLWTRAQSCYREKSACVFFYSFRCMFQLDRKINLFLTHGNEVGMTNQRCNVTAEEPNYEQKTDAFRSPVRAVTCE